MGMAEAIEDPAERYLAECMGAIQDATDGLRGPDQERIANAGIHWLATMLRKNADYGSAIWDVPVLTPGIDPADAILVRMSDKISRLQTLLSGKDAEVADETVADTMVDLGAYALLWSARPRKEPSATTNG